MHALASMAPLSNQEVFQALLGRGHTLLQRQCTNSGQHRIVESTLTASKAASRLCRPSNETCLDDVCDRPPPGADKINLRLTHTIIASFTYFVFLSPKNST